MNKKVIKVQMLILALVLFSNQIVWAENNRDIQQQTNEVSTEIPVLIDTIDMEESLEINIAPQVKSIISAGEYAGIGQQIADQFYKGVTGLQDTIYFNNYHISLSEFKDYLIESVWETKNMNTYVMGNSIRVWKYSNKYRIECIDSAVSDIWIYSDYTIEVIYNDKNIIQVTNRELEDKVETILARCREAESDIEKELIIHDYLVLNGEYDYDNLLNDTLPDESFSAYGILVKGTGVCQAYAYAMKLLLRRVGIPCDVVTGGDHAWNIVNIEGENYYVDTTWDDPVPDIKGYISRTHFNVTEEQLAASGHEWVASDYPSCDSTKYAFLQNTNEWIYKNGIWYYTASDYSEEVGYYVTNSLYSYNEEKQEEKLLILGSCTEIQLDEEGEGIYYIKKGEEQYYDLYAEAKAVLIPFVNKFYTACLDREGDEEGLNYWALQLAKGKKTGAQLATDFIYGDEFVGKALDDNAYIQVMYHAFFGREADAAGFDYWVKLLQSGITKRYILASFIECQEFENLCDEYGVVRGKITLEEPIDCYIHLTQFVYRFYQRALGRTAEQEGLNYWVKELHKGTLTGSDLAGSILSSEEFISRDLNDETFLGVMYSVFFDRMADVGGINYWKQCMKEGKTRLEVINEFVNSNEFKKVCEVYQITYR